MAQADPQKTNRLLQALIRIQLEDCLAQGGTHKPELWLAGKGLSYQDIAEIVDKKPDAVRMLLKRSKAT